MASAQAVPAGAAPATTRHVVSPVKGARVNPHQMPTQPPAGETPREVSRHYPVDRATYERPAQFSEGIVHVLVNGTLVVRNGASVGGVFPGRAIRKD